ncbi:MAG: hypothetical protein A2Y95_09390 [Deltaproteobacteria bacterium RBG_13_65_10]|nr:MAG: hypothetical protein A2Y95_09390 [Deltaproteobacteria bacterium RBG_13_65_10]
MVDRRGQEKPPEKVTEAPQAEAAKPDAAETEDPSSEEARSESQTPPTPINFVTIILSLSSNTLIQLGEIPDPFTKKMEKNLIAAKQTVDILGLLEEKTKGNLTGEESQALETVLYDLRMRYLRASGRL